MQRVCPHESFSEIWYTIYIFRYNRFKRYNEKIGKRRTFLNSEAHLRIVVEIGGGSEACGASTGYIFCFSVISPHRRRSVHPGPKIISSHDAIWAVLSTPQSHGAGEIQIRITKTKIGYRLVDKLAVQKV